MTKAEEAPGTTSSGRRPRRSPEVFIMRGAVVKKRRKWIIIAIVVVLVLSAVGWVVSKSRKGNGKEEVVRIEEVKRGI